MLAVIDMDMGNLGSVTRAFAHVGARVNVTGDPADLERADALILPGVGTFGDGMRSLTAKGLVEVIRNAVIERGVLLLGICVGMQLLASEGEEYGVHKGLGLVPGRVIELVPAPPNGRVPNMGWCPVQPAFPGEGLFTGIGVEEAFYFAHSFHLVCDDPSDVAAVTPWGDGLVTTAVRRGCVHGVQFHPEKSQDAGLEVVHAFWTMVKDRVKD